jgi:hypothetical protein
VIYRCCAERRLEAVRDAGLLNGIDYLEVSDLEAPSKALRQRTLFVRLLQAPAGLSAANIRISGGERIRSVGVVWAAPATSLPAGEDPALTAGLDDPATVLLVRTDSRGDFSTYTLSLVAGPASDLPPAGFDPRLASVDFSFKVECPSEFDCAAGCTCPPEPRPAPVADYLAKDYDSFRRLMLDRLSLLAPGWTERAPADLGVALVELLAYVADELSYRQDAVATEAYLGTARRRTSLRRHARLVDYVVHEGSNARAWARLQVAGVGVAVPRGTPLLTRVPGAPDVMDPDGPAHRAALAAGAMTFETVEDAVLTAAHGRLGLWTWGDTGCCLPRGATSATLLGDHPGLRAGDVLVLAEVAGPVTGRQEDADPARRAAVRLTSVVSSSDPSGGRFAEPPTNAVVDVTEIAWDDRDALPFPLCISVEAHPGVVFGEAWGNVVLADHGRTIAAEPLGVVPAPALTTAAVTGCDPCRQDLPPPVPARFRPTLALPPLTQARPAPSVPVAEGPLAASVAADLAALTFGPALHAWLQDRGLVFTASDPVVRGGDGAWSVSDGATVVPLRAAGGTLTAFARPASAAATMAADPRTALPAIALQGTLLGATEPWSPQVDLLGSDGAAADFVVESEFDGSATLRFGDGVHGRRPETGTSFAGTYRVGSGAAGNIGAGALAHVVTSDPALTGVDNPLAAAGGTDPETAGAIRRDAPEAYLVQERAVTRGDYEAVAERDPAVQRAAATFRWTGSWYTVFVAADRTGGQPVDAAFAAVLRRRLDGYRMTGYDLEVDAPHLVPLDVELFVCAEPDHFRAHVVAAVLDVLSSGVRASGTPGFFHPDRFTFGTPVYLSAIVAAAQAVPGVQSVTPMRFQRQRDDASSALDTGVLPMDRLEVARLDNDPSFPDRGVLTLTMGGGK